MLKALGIVFQCVVQGNRCFKVFIPRRLSEHCYSVMTRMLQGNEIFSCRWKCLAFCEAAYAHHGELCLRKSTTFPKSRRALATILETEFRLLDHHRRNRELPAGTARL
jgi:hypothetical protein